MTPLLAVVIIWIVIALGVFVWYLCSCDQAETWLTLQEWWRQITCRHKTGFLTNIDFDGTARYQCVACAKSISKPLKGN